MANSVDPDQTAPIVCSGSTLFASVLTSSVMLGSYLQQMPTADGIFRCIFSWRFKGYNTFYTVQPDSRKESLHAQKEKRDHHAHSAKADRGIYPLIY